MSDKPLVKRQGKQTAQASEQTRQSILDAAIHSFAEKGFEGASLREIALAAKTTHGLIRHHFGTKEDLWRVMFDGYVATFEAKMQALLANVENSDPEELLKVIVGHYVRVSAEFPEITKIIMNDCSRPSAHLDYVIERMLPLHNRIVPVFLAVQQKGLLTQHDPNSFYIFLSMLGSVPFALASFTNKFYKKKIDTRAGIDRHVTMVISTLFAH